MKRRGFLQLIGAAIAMPTLPAGTTTRPVGALAAAHAAKYPFVSALGLSRRLGVPFSEAQRILLDLSRRGIVGSVNSCGTGPMNAVSRVFRPTDTSLAAARARRDARLAKRERVSGQRHAKPAFDVDLTAFLRHLHGLCRMQGIGAVA